MRYAFLLPFHKSVIIKLKRNLLLQLFLLLQELHLRSHLHQRRLPQANQSRKLANATVSVSHLYAVRILSRKYTTSARRKVSPSCDIMEPFLQRGIDDYERLHGPVKPKRKKGVDSILN